MNNVSLIGRITNDLEVKATSTGKSVLNFCIAVNKDKETTYFIDCVAWNTTATNIGKFFKKGSQIANIVVDGAIAYRNAR